MKLFNTDLKAEYWTLVPWYRAWCD